MNSVLKSAALKRNPRSRKITAQTIATFRRNETRALAWAMPSMRLVGRWAGGRVPPAPPSYVATRPPFAGYASLLTVRSVSYHCIDRSVSDPSSCISSTMSDTAATNEAWSNSDSLSNATDSGS